MTRLPPWDIVDEVFEDEPVIKEERARGTDRGEGA